MTPLPRTFRAVAGAAIAAACWIAAMAEAPGGVVRAEDRVFARQSPFMVRPYTVTRSGRWVGEGIAYGPHRDGQFPGGPGPSRAQVREDLLLLAPHWNGIRIYNSVGTADSILSVIRDERLTLSVMLGVWIAAEDARDSTGALLEEFPEARAANRREVDAAVRLAAAYPGIVTSICVGNETQVFWSSHKVPVDLLVRYVREVRARSSAPVTVADDFNYWVTPASRAVADEVDFVVTHMHPLWNGQLLDGALTWTKSTYARVRAAHPGRVVVLGETGWATRRMTTGEQGSLMKEAASEAAQVTFCRAASKWVRRERIPVFFFEAFDENWKGSANPDDAEKHWGFYRADRTPKAIMRRGGTP